MLIKNAPAALLGTALLLIAVPVSAAGPTASMLSNTCAGCHGVDGASAGPSSPSIGGMSAAYFTDNMLAFKDGTRKSTIMGRIAKGYSEEEIELMAGWFASKPFVPAKQETDAAKVAEGEKLWGKNCEGCHSENGSAADDDAGILAGQWAPYLNTTTARFKAGGRPMPKKMAKKVNALDDSQLDAITNFLASQQ